jgi:hypothetical protein
MQSLALRVYDKGIAIILKTGRNMAALFHLWSTKGLSAHCGVSSSCP